MRSDDDVRRVFELWDQGLPKKAITRATGVARSQVRVWLEQGLEATLNSPMRRGTATHDELWSTARCPLVQRVDERAYAYLLGQYLGDGHLARHRRDVYRLRITTSDAYPNIRSECEAAVLAVMPNNKVGVATKIGCADVSSYSKHWPCLLPQHGHGRKHERPILLRRWQELIVYKGYPELLLRGLIHSDGCRCINVVKRSLKSGLKRYEYPRYMFSNASRHILGIFTHACDLLEVNWRWDGERQISIARRESVEKFDSFVGPKS